MIKSRSYSNIRARFSLLFYFPSPVPKMKFIIIGPTKATTDATMKANILESLPSGAMNNGIAITPPLPKL